MHHPERIPRPFRRLSCVLALALVALPATGSGSTDAFFDTDFDGTWVGTLDLGARTVPVQASFNVEDGTGVALLRMPDADTGEVALFTAEFRKIKARRLILDYEDAPADADADPVQITVILRYKAAQDALQGKVKGGVKGRVTLERTDASLPLGRLWAGTVRLGGDNLDLLMQLSETEPAGGSRAAVNTVTGWATLGDDQGKVTGSRNGKSVDLTVDLKGGDLAAHLRLAHKDGQLKGNVEQAGAGTRAKLLPEGSNNGKPMKAKNTSPGEVAAGATSTVTVKGKNFGEGIIVHADDPSILVGAAMLSSPRSLDVEVGVPDGTTDGTEISLRVVNGDGQVDEIAGALTVAADGGGDGGPMVSFAAQVQPILTANCTFVGCHNSGSAQQGMVLEPGSAYGDIVNVPSTEQPALNRIAPGDPDNSYLVRKIRGDAGIVGGRMPLNRSPLSAAQIQTIVDWVLQGAPNNGPSRR